MNEPIFYGASLVNILVLIVVGVSYSAFWYAIAEGYKRLFQITKPRSQTERLIITLGPILGATVFALWAFPAAVIGVGIEVELSEWRTGADPLFILLSAVMGFAGGLGAKVAHDWLLDWLEAARIEPDRDWET